MAFSSVAMHEPLTTPLVAIPYPSSSRRGIKRHFFPPQSRVLPTNIVSKVTLPVKLQQELRVAAESSFWKGEMKLTS